MSWILKIKSKRGNFAEIDIQLLALAAANPKMKLEDFLKAEFAAYNDPTFDLKNCELVEI